MRFIFDTTNNRIVMISGEENLGHVPMDAFMKAANIAAIRALKHGETHDLEFDLEQ